MALLSRKMKLGEMLVKAGRLTELELQQALAAKKGSNLKLGKFLIRQGKINETQLVDFLSHQLKLKKYHSNKYPVDRALTNLISAEIAQKHQVAPLKKMGNLLTIAMTEPMDIAALDAIEAQTNLEVDPVVCTEHQLNQLIGSLYGTHSDLDGVLDSIEDISTDEDTKEEETSRPDDFDISALHGMVEEAPVIRLVNSILSQAIRENASDIHISPEKDYIRLRFRVDGRLHDVPTPSKSMFLPMVSRIKLLAGMDIAVSRMSQDGRFTVKKHDKEINIRASTLPTTYGEKLVLRLLDMSATIYSLDLLGMSQKNIERIESVIYEPHGMILSTGPTGSGKSTSLYSILNKINEPDINIITLEDPVEFRMERIEQIQLNRKAGMTFASGLRSILRQDPDVIMVGEIRDTETASIAVQAAMTGHRVLSTIHTNDSAGAIARFLDLGIEPFLVSSVMLVSFAQRLVRRNCSYCKEPYSPPKEALAKWGLDKVEGADFQRGKGCFNCFQTGYLGRTGIFEVLVIDKMIQEMIAKSSPVEEITNAATIAGKLKTLKEDAARKVLEGITTLEEAMGVAPTQEASRNGAPQVAPNGTTMAASTETRRYFSMAPAHDMPIEGKPPVSEMRRDRIMVVDDDEIIRVLLKKALEAEHYDVALAVDGDDALEKVFQNPPDLIIIDYMMPKMNGIDLIKKLKSYAHIGQIPIIMLTVTETEVSEVQALAAGADDWIRKPVHVPRLLARMKRLLK